MGAGNPILRSFDPGKFEPKTYFLDLSVEPEEGEEPDYFLEELNFEDLLESLCSELELTSLYKKEEYYSELCAAFRKDGIIMLEGELTYVITETESEYHHLPIAVIPNFKWEDLREDIEYREGDKQEWYDARGLDFDERLNKLADKEYYNKLKKFSEESNKILTTLHGWYSKGMSQRCGAWTSTPLVQVGENHFKLEI
jgi:hypothetical protein